MRWRSTVAGILLVFVGCTMFRTRDIQPTNHSIVREQLVFHSDFRLARHHRLLDELVGLRTDISQGLQLPISDEPIHVFLFKTPSHYREYLNQQYPELPDRRAFFVESDTQLTVYAHWGDRVAEDLRHEVSHGYLHAVVRNQPLWLDEGLAEYFEVARGRNGLNLPHAKMLMTLWQNGAWKPDLPRLETIVEASALNQQDYAESWAWMHLMMNSTPDRLDLLRNYLARLRMTGTAPAFSAILNEHEPEYAQILVEHLQSVTEGNH